MIKGAKKEEVDYATDFLSSLTYTIEKVNQENKHKPSATFSPSSMKCDRQMIYKLLSVPIDDKKDSYQLVGICESGTDRHEHIQSYVNKMKDMDIDCEYINVADYVREHKLPLRIGKESNFLDEFETHLYTYEDNEVFPYNSSFLCDGIIKFKGKYFILEIKTQASMKAMRQTDVQEEHKAQATAYSLFLGINDVMFLYEDRDLLGKKCFIYSPTEEEKNNLQDRLLKDWAMYKNNTICAKPDVDRKVCLYCAYKKTCSKGGKSEYQLK
jgi:CRISPR/Cas system-associated exonuclease Cas4 (RecB family)